MDATSPIFDTSKPYASVLALAIESKLLSLRDISAWLDAAILWIHRPPYWLLDLASAKKEEEALAAIGAHCYSEPFEQLPDASDIFTSCLFLRYLRGDFGWAEFLRLAGVRNDGIAGRKACEYFYAMLTAYEKSSASPRLEATQKAEISQVYISDLARVCSLTDDIKKESNQISTDNSGELTLPSVSD